MEVHNGMKDALQNNINSSAQKFLILETPVELYGFTGAL